MPSDSSLPYYAVGVYNPAHPARRGEEAWLEFATLDEALSKVKDWIEADDIDEDEDAPMFVRYAIARDPPPQPMRVPCPMGHMRLVQD